MKHSAFFILLAGLFADQAFGNNLDIANVALHPVSRKQAVIELDLSWDDGWRDEANHDSAWLFVKYSLDDGATWSHATLKASGVNPPGFGTGSNAGIEIAVPADRKGAFVRRIAPGRGQLATTGMQLVWDLQADGVPANALGRISVHGLEMVYIPAGPFFVGDGVSGGSFAVTYINTDTMTNAVAAGAGTIESPRTNLTAGIGRPYGVTGVFTNLYPNGYNAFYIMKYELSRARYLDFLNQITASQAATMRSQSPNFAGSTGTITGSHPNFTNTQPWRAVLHAASIEPSCSGWREYFAYTDWAGLRPFSEMEYEKASRGPIPPKVGDYPWGLTARHIVNRFQNSNTPAESAAITAANLISAGTYTSIFPASPMRNGAMSNAETDQFQSGASYYGVMEMAGNTWERCIATANLADARNFSALHGDGVLNGDGTANVPNWPYPAVRSYGNGPIGTRGGDSAEASLNCTVSYRGRSQQNYYTAPGIRAARTAP